MTGRARLAGRARIAARAAVGRVAGERDARARAHRLAGWARAGSVDAGLTGAALVAAAAAVVGIVGHVDARSRAARLMRRTAAPMLAAPVLGWKAHLALRAAGAVALDPVRRAASGHRGPRVRRRECGRSDQRGSTRAEDVAPRHPAREPTRERIEPGLGEPRHRRRAPSPSRIRLVTPAPINRPRETVIRTQDAGAGRNLPKKVQICFLCPHPDLREPGSVRRPGGEAHRTQQKRSRSCSAAAGSAVAVPSAVCAR